MTQRFKFSSPKGQVKLNKSSWSLILCDVLVIFKKDKIEHSIQIKYMIQEVLHKKK